MLPVPCRSAPGLSPRLGVLIVSEVRFLRESLADILQRAPALEVRGQSATLAQALAAAITLRPDIVLLDVAFAGGMRIAAHLCAALPEASVIALAVAETEDSVLAWAATGIAGYVPNTASVDDLVILVEQITHGEQSCSPRVAGSLLRRLRAGFQAEPVFAATPLTPREQEIYDLIGAGLSNKAIARQLSISLSTAKSHVHNILNKLNLTRRAQVMVQLQPGRRAAATASSIYPRS